MEEYFEDLYKRLKGDPVAFVDTIRHHVVFDRTFGSLLDEYLTKKGIDFMSITFDDIADLVNNAEIKKNRPSCMIDINGLRSGYQVIEFFNTYRKDINEFLHDLGYDSNDLIKICELEDDFLVTDRDSIFRVVLFVAYEVIFTLQDVLKNINKSKKSLKKQKKEKIRSNKSDDSATIVYGEKDV